ncbi:hypothetical protein E3P77_00492 [Wallemia ichthyophaga]|uniref:Protein NIF3-like protein n=3 Tax=Wallemia ichthyophaga TaxID=245174 RepID=A0A4T0EMD4_WALIC|nr:Protein NIF3-like protein [Wallemia ichthyophaga EXF-994]TIA75557.1 hypothetical protein E3P91_00326 [Wallemia ichthyophaga]EOR01735.1 Protein NIF3-like protein [Wallemia ichthyophaga EXF-994]TIA93848.1 hypothetical protein E3P97_00623 [Wallemia ichthyophaga]TIB35246.1 hypothetical protein E3P85_00479 [Wallemia ichthyophaga]TIB37104.1 hypothetical protein E3P84_00481 [Wallemia ichthyophaga]
MATTNAKIVSRAMQRIAPLELADKSWDNVGLLVESPQRNGSGQHVVIVNDLTEKVFDRIISDNPFVSVVVSYHPPIFKPLKSITTDNPIQRTLLKCISNGISVYSPHTACDAVRGGVNDWMFTAITGHKTSNAIIPTTSTIDSHHDAGMGRYGTFASPQDPYRNPMRIKEVINHIKSVFNLDTLQFADGGKKHINSVAVCAGSGSSILSKAPSVDLYVTGEMGHHDVLAAVANGTSVILLNHSNSERVYLQTSLRDALTEAIQIEREEAKLEPVKWKVTTCVEDKDPLVSV